MKRFLSIVLAAMMVFSALTVFTVTASADDGWTLSDDGVLTLTQDIVKEQTEYPWDARRGEITKVVVADGVTVVGHHSFTRCPNLVEVVTGKDCVELGADAFSYCTKLNTITFGAAISKLGQGVVFGTGNIKTVTLTRQNEMQFKHIVATTAYNTDFNKAEFKMVGSVDAAKLNLKASYSTIENWSGRTYFLVGDISVPVLEELKNGNLSAKVVITDETENKTYTISNYALFGGEEEQEISTAYGLFRVAACEYGIVPVPGHEYTIAIELSDVEGTVVYAGASAKGAFNGGNDDFKAKGAIIPDSFVPYTEGPTKFDLSIYGIGSLNGWENWEGQTCLLLKPSWKNNNVPLFCNMNTTWELTFTDENGVSKTVNLKPSSMSNAGTKIVRFQPCCGTDGNWFIPESGKSYAVTAKVKLGDTVVFESKNAANTELKADVEPIVHSLAVEKTAVNADSVSFVASLKDTLGQKYVNELNSMKLTATFKQNGETVKTFVSETSAVYATLIGVASADATTAAAQGVSYIDASYLFGMTVSGIPAGSYTVELTAEGMNAEGTVITAANTVTVTVA